MSFRHARHFARVYNTPLLISPGALDAMLPAIESVLRGQPTAPSAFQTAATERSANTELRMAGSIAVLPIHGVLAHRSTLDEDCNFLLGYQTIVRMVNAAISDPAVDQIVLDIDSHGGEVAGCFDAVEHIRAAAAVKPIHAAVNDHACSAAYALASACASISVTRTGSVGSIGVLMRHVDMSAWIKNEGISVTHIFAGDHKIDGNPYEPLPPAVRARFQRDIDALYGLFVETVATNRNISPAAVRATQADVFMGQAGIDIGLADLIETPDQLIHRLEASAPGFSSTAIFAAKPEANMPTEDKAAPPAAPIITQADIDASEQLGREAERERILGIIGHESASANMQVAIQLAGNPSMTVEGAGAVLAAIPAPAKPSADNQFAAHMQGIQAQQNVGAEDPDTDPEAAAAQLWDRAIARVMQ